MEQESHIIFDRKPDRLELVVRAVCGALFGVLFGTYSWLRFFSDLQPWAAVVFILTIAAGCAFFAARYGDRFWEGMLGGGNGFGRRGE